MRAIPLRRSSSDCMQLIFHLGGITTRGDETSPCHLGLLAESSGHGQRGSLLRQPKLQTDRHLPAAALPPSLLSQQRMRSQCLCRMNNNPVPQEAARGFPPSLSPSSPTAQGRNRSPSVFQSDSVHRALCFVLVERFLLHGKIMTMKRGLQSNMPRSQGQCPWKSTPAVQNRRGNMGAVPARRDQGTGE